MTDVLLNQVPQDANVTLKSNLMKIVCRFGPIFCVFSLILIIYLLTENRQLKLKLLMEPLTATEFKVVDSPEPTKASIPLPANANAYTQVSSCNSEECLFTNGDTPEGYAKIEGYYHEYSFDDWGTPATCKGFIVTGGNDTLIANFNKWIDDGNGLNKRIDGNLIVNLNLSDLDNNIVNLVAASNINKKVELGVLRLSPQGRGVSTCHSVMEILMAKSINK